jgi:hypothetical protein
MNEKSLLTLKIIEDIKRYQGKKWDSIIEQ